jgi:hypothetical protein
VANCMGLSMNVPCSSIGLGPTCTYSLSNGDDTLALTCGGQSLTLQWVPHPGSP